MLNNKTITSSYIYQDYSTSESKHFGQIQNKATYYKISQNNKSPFLFNRPSTNHGPWPKTLNRKNIYTKHLLCTKGMISERINGQDLYMISFIVCYLTGKMCNCTNSISLAHNHRVCGCYVEPCSDLICFFRFIRIWYWVAPYQSHTVFLFFTIKQLLFTIYYSMDLIGVKITGQLQR